MNLREIINKELATPQERKDILRASIQASVDAFLADGNRINHVPMGLSSENVGATLTMNEYWSRAKADDLLMKVARNG